MIRAGDLCSRRVMTVAPGDAVASAVELMRREHVGDVIVATSGADGQRPAGILTDRDVVLELLAPGISQDQVTVGDCMTEELVVAREDEDLLVALERMAMRGVRRLPVVDQRGLLAGILSVDDVLAFIGEASAAIAEIIAQGRSRERVLRG